MIYSIEQQTAALKPVCSYLRRLGVVAIVVQYDGSGDEGGIEEIEVLREVKVGIEETIWNAERDKALQEKLAAKAVPKSLQKLNCSAYAKDMLEWMGDFLVFFAPDGYENGNGGRGQVLLNVQQNRVDVNHGSCRIDYDFETYSCEG